MVTVFVYTLFFLQFSLITISKRFMRNEQLMRLLLDEENVSVSKELSDNETEDNAEVDDVESYMSHPNPSDDEDIKERVSSALTDDGLQSQTPLVEAEVISGNDQNILSFSSGSRSCLVMSAKCKLQTEQQQ